ncbi:hypothetical protein ZMO02_16900 [Zymomonas mobilis subsp. pomaceae]|nr:hypothetical protein ZMO02_16900 [Zymomonas mobilis subsp. pomaceae]
MSKERIFKSRSFQEKSDEFYGQYDKFSVDIKPINISRIAKPIIGYIVRIIKL